MSMISLDLGSVQHHQVGLIKLVRKDCLLNKKFKESLFTEMFRKAKKNSLSII